MEYAGLSAVLFDLDGVLTPTAILHERAWGAMFTPFLAARGASPWTRDDYTGLVDGLPRYDGVAALLASRGIALPYGRPDDAPGDGTICALGNTKNAILLGLLEEIAPFPEVAVTLEALRAAGVRLGVVSSSANAGRVLAAAGLADEFDVVVDGRSIAAQGLAGKPAPDGFRYGAELLGVDASRAAVVEDAVPGVAAGRAGGFGLVVGVDRADMREALLAGGADVVIAGLDALPGLCAAGGTWRLTWPGASPDSVGEDAICSLTCLANGRLGVRGATGLRADEAPGTYLNGFYETGRIEYPEDAYGMARVSQVIQAAPEATAVRLVLGGEALGEPDTLTRRLDLRAGTLTWEATYARPDGVLVVAGVRIVSLVEAGLCTTRLTLTWSGPGTPLDIALPLAAPDGRRGAPDGLDPRRADGVPTPAATAGAVGGAGLVRLDAPGAGRGIVALSVLDDPTATLATGPESATHRLGTTLHRGEPLSIVRHVVYAAGTTDDPLEQDARTVLTRARADGWAGVAARQRAWLDGYWDDADLTIRGADDDLVALRWHLFQVAQASACHGEWGIAAKGITGSGYSGHYFWDTEVYLAPMLAFTRPALARGLLEYRHATLDAARRRAGDLSLAGACFPWRTITGEEASAYFLAGSAAYHVNAAIAFAIGQYVQVSGDEAFLGEAGAEILAETARMWASLASGGDDGRAHLNGVTGPDEYSVLVDDNVYTNVMARHHLRLAARAAEDVLARDPAAAARLGLDAPEADTWRRLADRLVVPFDERRGIHPQDAGFLAKAPWNVPGPTRHPLLLHYHPLVIYRHRVLKQADVVMAIALRPSDFAPVDARADFDFYEPLTTGDSSLSAIPQAIVAARVGRMDAAERHFRDALAVDLANTHANTVDGLHVASAGGTWSVVVLGFAGLRLPEPGDDWDLAFDPVLPASWDGLAFGLRWRGARLRVDVSRTGNGTTETALRVLDGGPVRVLLDGRVRCVGAPGQA
ncbi:MAG: HAD-IA family hydrolase [Actinomycetia bacterium]|nr:HAD-IA family hydrolase [Actinomycetes bacterium]